jgi:prephenate dehydrogenase
MMDGVALQEARVAIVGLGLMGGSLAAALSNPPACRQRIGIARRQETLDEARGRGWIDRGYTNLLDGVRKADVVVLATPPRVIIAQLEAMTAGLPPGCVVMDLGSTKGEIVAAMEHLPPHVNPIGGHPMCGRELAGLSAADASLFRGRPFVLTPLPRTPDSARELARALALAVGARPIFLEAVTHDRIVAQVSHLPHLAAVALVRAAMIGAEQDPELWSLVAGGFRDTTRLAASDVTMLLDMLLTNREMILAAAQRYRDELDVLCGLLEAGEEGALRARLDDAIAQRRRMT